MLSYRHAFHAGNFADVLKHLVLVNTLQYATAKAAPLFYLDTHAGAGYYRLNSPEAEKTGEAMAGIRRLDFPALINALPADSAPLLQRYGELLTPHLEQDRYPGSPLLAAAVLRRNDHLHLCELHPQDFNWLEGSCKDDRRIRTEQADGYQRALTLLPPAQKRAVVLIDPSYEVKEDYQRTVRLMNALYQRMPSVQILLWYPVVYRQDITRMIASMRHGPMKDVWQIELGLGPDTEERGMTASGMILVNPPWSLPDQLRSCLPLIQQALAPEHGHWDVENLIHE